MKLKLMLTLLCLSGYTQAQLPLAPTKHHLEKRVSLTVKNTKISEVLTKISRPGAFYFSYSGALSKTDSLVNLDVRNEPVRTLLDLLFNNKVDYKENGDYIILRSAAHQMTIIPENITTAEKLYLIVGHVIDTKTGHKIKQASVYEKRLLQSTLTDNDGFFKLRFKGTHQEVILTASKENYRDTTLIFLSDTKVKPTGYDDPDAAQASGISSDVERSGWARFLISSRQKIQSLNIPDFFANSPFQASFTPGLSSHGMMSSQVINKFSLNVLGGYTAGTNGFEIAGLFNMTKGDVKKLQFAGLFNEAGGSLKGFQVAGLLNNVSKEKKGIQAAGLINRVRGETGGFQIAGISNLSHKNMQGAQAAGITNLVAQNVDGVQIAGIVNLVRKNVKGTQIAGIGNMTRHLKGVQIAGILNYAKKMEGFQVGLINVADTSSGYSLGLINLVKNGYHKISLFANETVNTNLSIKMGNAKLYTILFAGSNLSQNEKVRTAGLGLGHDFIFNQQFSMALETTGQLLYLGHWDSTNLLSKVQANLQMQLIKGITLFAGPAYALYTSNSTANSSAPGYKQNVVPKHHTSFSSHAKGWLGFNAGITFM